MDKKAIALLVFILIIVVIGIVAYINMSNNSESNTQNQLSNNQESNNNNEEIAQTTTNETNTVEEQNTNTNQENQNGKILVLYFSQSGNTEAVANIIHDEVGGDIIKLETEVAYPSDYNELLDYAQEEQRENARPALSTRIENIDEYDTIFLGYPNWWADMPMSIYTFLDEYDLSGKTIAPFITHGGSGLSGTPRNIQEEEPNATVTDGLAINGSSSRNSQNTIINWLSEIGF